MTEPAVLELGTGFRDDEVTVLLDGREVWSGGGITTDYSIGLAAVVPLPGPVDGQPLLEVRVGSRARGAERLPGPAAAGPVRLRCDLDPAGAMALGTAPEGPMF
ncbi:hypothetical protein [Blastococcus saxobsidens]|nr:hypothetical protein [Blastococcus saxobsidens]